MRKAFFALLMVAAAFAGGAVVNGPGIAWLQALGRLVVRTNEIVRVVSPNTSISTATSTSPEADTAKNAGASSSAISAPPSAVPAAPLPPLVLNRPKAAAEVKDSANPKELAPGTPAAPGDPGAPPTAVAVASPTPDQPAPPAPLPSTAIEIPAPPPGPVSAATPGDPPVLSSAPPLSAGALGGSTPTADAAVKQAAASQEPARPATSSLPTGRANDWPELRRRLKEAGVSRFEVDAELSGRTRFRCLIPLAGRRAIGQMFEGEGDDEFQAAESVLRRILLWKVSEKSNP